MFQTDQKIQKMTTFLTHIISETNGISLADTIKLLMLSKRVKDDPYVEKSLLEFRKLLVGFHADEVEIETLLKHDVSLAFFNFFKNFPIPFYDEHIHLTGSIGADFIFPRLKALLAGPSQKMYEKRIVQVYGKQALPIQSPEDLDKLIRLQSGEGFSTYLRILFMAKLVLKDEKAHEEAAYHLAKEIYEKYNVGNIRLKFTISRATGIAIEKLPHVNKLTEEDTVMGIYRGLKKFQRECPNFGFILSPCFRKESTFFDQENYRSKQEHFNHQVQVILRLLRKYPELTPYLCEVDTVGNERELYRKKHFEELKTGLRILQGRGLRVRSHHGETWKILRKGIQSVDNAMNIWHIDTLEHGLSLGINPNFYFHRLYQKVMELNRREIPLTKNSTECLELVDMEWFEKGVEEKLLKGQKLSSAEERVFLKTKFHTAREVEHYQHDVLNRIIDKNVGLVSLPSSNLKLTSSFSDYKDHPFSWWEKKEVSLGMGTDNFITLSTNYIQEMLILLYSDPENLKITKLLMVVTKENRRPVIARLLWEMTKRSQRGS